MSLSSTSALKAQLIKALGTSAQVYFDALSSFVSGKSSRQEFEEMTKQVLTSPHLLQLHNALIISLFDATATLKRPPTPPPPTLPKPPPQKRRRTLLPYQGPEVAESSRSIRGPRLKRWALSVGKRERERVKSLETAPPPFDPPRPRKETDEIAAERGVELILERGDPPGSRVPIHLHASTRAPTLQHITDRVNLISAQNGLQNPARNVSQLMRMACEAKLKQLITHALTLTSTSHAISSIAPALPSSSTGLHHFPTHSHANRPPVLTPDSFHTLFTVSPADLPNGSAAAMRFATGPSAIDQGFDPSDPLFALIKEREKEAERLREKEREKDREKARLKEKAKVKTENDDVTPGIEELSGNGDHDRTDHGPDEQEEPHGADDLRDDPRWQLLALLAHRSTVRDSLRGGLNANPRGGKLSGMGMGMGLGMGIGKGR